MRPSFLHNRTIGKTKGADKGAIDMVDKERVMKLVKEGIITKEDAITLLEEESTEQKIKADTGVTISEDSDNSEGSDSDILEKVLNKISSYSVKVDATDQKIKKSREKLARKVAKLEKLAANEDLTGEDLAKISALEDKIESLKEEIEVLTAERDEAKEHVEDVEKGQFEAAINKVKEKVKKTDGQKIKNDVVGAVNDVLPEASATVQKYANRLVDFVNQEFGQRFNSSKPRKTTESDVFHTVTKTYDADVDASVLDVKIATGDLTINPSDDGTYKVVVLYRPLRQFTQSELEEKIITDATVVLDEEQTRFHFSNAYIAAEVTVYVPEINFDYVSLKVITGNIKAEHLKGQDFLLKVKQGDIKAKDLHGTMLEVDHSIGNTGILSSSYRDAVIKNGTGNAKIDGDISGLILKTKTGNAKFRLGKSLKSLTVKTMTGNILWVDADFPAVNFKATTKVGKISHPFIGDGEAVDVTENETTATGSKVALVTINAETEPITASLESQFGNIKVESIGKTTDEPVDKPNDGETSDPLVDPTSNHLPEKTDQGFVAPEKEKNKADLTVVSDDKDDKESSDSKED